MNVIEDIGQAASLVSKASRIMVVGSSGGGKTTLSQALASYRNLEYFSIDRDVRWISGWTQREVGEQHRILEDIVRRDRWLLDGSGPSTFELRLPRTDIVIWMRLPRLTCLMGVAKRVARYYGTVRPYMASGCREPLPNMEFLSYIWNFEKRHAPVFLRNFELYGPQVPIFQVKSRAQARQLLDLIGSAH
ncbi:AAA family ATPase [Agrobacterium rosae]|uniref:AAA family ATPase n=1 Tax=Agrobacterium rosae TaxID=1972867 RepID=A0AAE5VP91_9HYPH|nr:AAA family ATPase [Agrobacterium rosae]KAA3509885.1 AAA family ATPase [Agrobacterium rosae]KAA3515167.1 AAA family ATPase [Agrobacterium rosae]MCM2433083.1 AAA family ATPase [Agrobacterium rosae]MDX8331414.1 AAA family ATPase [Agrobacterium rosae]MQB50468.1 AAA family ATPase [Agrobacterium rosae]